MNQKRQIPPARHRGQIARYGAEREVYVTYAAVLKRALRQACVASIPEAVVQSRAKTVSSFAGKSVRKYPKYTDPVNQLTDLCGARVLVQTLQQVLSVCRFVEHGFLVHEKEDKALSLDEETFGYRDMHYVVSLSPDRCEALGITSDERARIGDRRAEIQVRTWLQHAWADTLHDRVYKNPLELPRRVRRMGALQAALMEEADRNFSEMAEELDGMIANYAAYADRDAVEEEIQVRRLLLENEPDEVKKPGLALRLARLLAGCGRYAEVADVLAPYEDRRDPTRSELLSELGFALCQDERAEPSEQYARGLDLLAEAIRGESPERPFVVDLRASRSRRARTHHRLGWALEVAPGERAAARGHYQRAQEIEPDNPYYLASMLGFELESTRESALLLPMRGAMRQGVRTCHRHAVAGIELPYAYFTAGRLSLLLSESGRDEAYAAFGWYARGLRYCLHGNHCVPPQVIDHEVNWIRDLHGADEPSAAMEWVLGLFDVAERVRTLNGPGGSTAEALIVVGGAAGMDEETVDVARPLVEAVLKTFHGTVVSGGTDRGLPGCVGAVAEDLETRGEKGFELRGYIPDHLPHDAPRDERYDRLVLCGKTGFTPEQLLRTWSDLLDDGLHPREVMVLCLGGGRLSEAECRLALSLGATVAVVSGTGGAADELIEDPVWSDLSNLLPVPFDLAAVRALAASPEKEFSTAVLDRLARSFHEAYLAASTSQLPGNLRPWHELPETFRSANREQAKHAVEILEAHGFGVRASSSPTVLELEPGDPKVQEMAEAEHGRWVVERLRDGWRPGPRDDDSRTHPFLVPWEQVPDHIRQYDVNAVLRYPEILAQAGLEVFRRD